MKTAKLPTLTDLTRLVKAVKPYIADDYRAFFDDDLPGIQLTIGWSPDSGDWSFQTGDNSYTGSAYHYPVWAVAGVYRRSNSREVARELRDELDEQAWDWEDEK